MRVKLPNGLLDGQDHFNYIVISELTGKQQNYLADRELLESNIGHIPKIISDMIVSLETKEGLQWKGNLKELVWKLPAGDLETIIIKIRENTFGSRYYFEAVCEHCGHINKNQRLDLDKLKVESITLKQMMDPNRRTIKLPKSGKTVLVKPLYLQDMFDSLKIAKDNQDKLITSIIALNIANIDGKEDITTQDIEDLPMMDIYHLQDKLEDMKLEGFIDTDIEMDCNSCKKEFKTELNLWSPDFFFHTRGSKNTRS